jgi:hypothetical protein
MKRNVGGMDRTLRVAAGIALLAFGILAEGPWHWVGLLGAVVLVTGLVRVCPAYTLLGLSTDRGAGSGRLS